MNVRDLEDNEYEVEDEARYTPERDPVSVAVGTDGFLARHVLDDCRETFPESRVSGFPEMFDRYYWEPAPLLVDILEDGTQEQVVRERERKRVEFKSAWCAEHDRRYLVLTATEAQDAQVVRELIHDLGRTDMSAPGFAQGGVVPKRPERKRGQVQRPKAAA